MFVKWDEGYTFARERVCPLCKLARTAAALRYSLQKPDVGAGVDGCIRCQQRGHMEVMQRH